MKAFASIGLLLLTAYMFIGCATDRSLYYWDGYSASLYKTKKNPGEESLDAHKKILLTIIQEAQTKGKKVPPGVYVEYGYLLLKEGNTDEALRYFDLEEQLYPESRFFMRRLRTFSTEDRKGKI